MSIFRGGDNDHCPLAWFYTKDPDLSNFLRDQARPPQPLKDVYVDDQKGVLWCVPTPPADERRKRRTFGISVFDSEQTAAAGITTTPFIYEIDIQDILSELDQSDRVGQRLVLSWDKDHVPLFPHLPGHGVFRVAEPIPAEELVHVLRRVPLIRRFPAPNYNRPLPPPRPLLLNDVPLLPVPALPPQ